MIMSGAVAPGMHEIDINVRHGLVVSRIKMGDIEKGQVWLFPIRIQIRYL